MFIFTFGDVLSVLLVVLLLAVAVWRAVAQWLRERKCLHEKIWENGQLHAICQACGKDLGFIETWQKNRDAP